MTPKEFIEKSIFGGYLECNYVKERGHRTFVFFKKSGEIVGIYNLFEIFLDPKAWEAVGKVEGWGEMPSGDIWQGKLRFKYNMHRMIDSLIEGKSIDDFLATL